MTRPLSEVTAVLSLRGEGLSARRIARQTGLPIKTVQDWIRDPDHALDRPIESGSGKPCHGCMPRAGLDQSSYSYLLGQYLGDGHIVHTPNSFRLVISCDQKYPGIIRDLEFALNQTMPDRRVLKAQRVGCIAVISNSKHWPCFMPQHGPGLKHERNIQLENWQTELVRSRPRPFIRGLIHSDGWRGDNVAIRHTELAIEYHTYTRYQFSNRSKDIRDLFCWALDLVGVHWTQSNQWTISVSRRKDVHYLDSFVGPKR
jgi:hypothetical protein